jgi:hypothetical protein
MTGDSIMAAKPSPSDIKLKPGPEVAVTAIAPARPAPEMACMEAISSSIWIKTPPRLGRVAEARVAISDAGVMG